MPAMNLIYREDPLKETGGKSVAILPPNIFCCRIRMSSRVQDFERETVTNGFLHGDKNSSCCSGTLFLYSPKMIIAIVSILF